MKRILSIVITAILAGAFAFTGLAPASASPRTGALHITKECSLFEGQPGGFCTITKSNRQMMIPIGSRVIYVDPVFTPGLESNIELETTPGNIAYGHVFLDFVTGTGTVTFYGGTGTFEDFHASADVSAAGGYDWDWKGTYHFGDD
jgi:hypothetical protein